MPGPLLATVIAESAGGRFRSGPLITLGHALLEGALLALLMLGCGTIIRSTGLLTAITLAGSAFLAYSGITMLLALKTLTIEKAMKHSRTPLQLITAGIVVSVTNPYWTVWWVTVGLGLALAAQKTGIVGVTAFFCGHITADILWYSFISFLIAGRRSFISTRVYKAILCCCALTLIGFALFFALKPPLSVR